MWWLAAFGAMYALSTVMAPFGDLLVDGITRRVDGLLAERVMTAAMGPDGIAHLEVPEMQRAFSAARNRSSLGMSPGGIVKQMVPVVVYRVTQAGIAIGLCVVWWPAGIVWIVLAACNHVAMARAFARMLSGARGRLDEREAHYYRDLAVTAPAAKEVRVFGLGGWLEDRYRVSLATARELARKEGTNEFTPPLLALLLVNAIVSVATIVWVGHLAASGRIGLGAAAFALYAVRTLGPTLWVPDAFISFAIGSLDAITTAEGLAAERPAATGTLEGLGAPAGSVRFENVSFRYPGSDIDVLSGLDLEIRAGERLALVGVNGAGKTTIVKLLCKLYEPTGGRIVVDDTDLCEFATADWRRQLGVLFQDFLRFELPARDNVVFGAVDAAQDPDRLERVAARIGVDTIVAGLPSGWETPLSGRVAGGADLSGGQWQRVAFARALYAADVRARLLVLDEPTANLDVRAEAELYERFVHLSGDDGRGPLTTLLISHRFSTVRQADRIVVLDGGRLIEDGSHDHLIAMGGQYAAMFNAQAARFTDDPEPDKEPTA